MQEVEKAIEVPSPYITQSEAARYAGVSLRVIRKWMRSGLKHARVNTKTIRTRHEWVDEFMRHHAQEPNPTPQWMAELSRKLKKA